VKRDDEIDPNDAWARLRFSVIGHLLAAPPERGALDAAFDELSRRDWRHPVTREPVRFSKKAIERWYYTALGAGVDPVARLRKKRRRDAGRQPSIPETVAELIRRIRRDHPDWTMQLVADELRATIEADGQPIRVPSYPSVRRFMKREGLDHRLKKRRRHSRDEPKHRAREARRYEVDRLHALWHLDFHHGSRRVLTGEGRWLKAILLCVLDDHSRLVCHAQWFLGEETEDLVHGFVQACQKRGLPRALLSDNGSAMTSEEFRSGLSRLGIVHETTLPYHPAQNGKQERFFGTLEGRLMALLSHQSDLTLADLNLATQAWIEQEYHVTVQRELGVTPRDRALAAKDASRECPGSDVLRRAFMRDVKRRPRRQTATITLHGVRFEVPVAYRHFEWLHVRYARWDLSVAWLVDPNGEPVVRIRPEDPVQNAEGRRRAIDEAPADLDEVSGGDEMPALLRKYLADFAADGRPPAYVPKPQKPKTQEKRP